LATETQPLPTGLTLVGSFSLTALSASAWVMAPISTMPGIT
jgi:hypothetical protein